MVRFKNRWLLLSLDLPTSPLPTPSDPSSSTSISIPPTSLLQSIRSSLLTHFGPTTSGALSSSSSLSVKYTSDSTRLAILRCARTGAETVRGGVSLIGRLEVNVVTKGETGKGGSSTRRETMPVRIHVVAVSGTIKKLQERVIKRDRKEIAERRAAIKRGEKRRDRGKKKGLKETVDGQERAPMEGGASATRRGETGADGQQDDASVGSSNAQPAQSSITYPGVPASMGDEDEEDLGLAV